MEPSNMRPWSRTPFVIKGKITFSIYKEQRDKVSEHEMLAAVVLADREKPWWDNGWAARLSINEPQRQFEDMQSVVYLCEFQSACTLSPSQLPAYVKYTADLAQNARNFIRNAEAVCWIGSTVEFQGTSIIFYNQRPVQV